MSRALFSRSNLGKTEFLKLLKAQYIKEILFLLRDVEGEMRLRAVKGSEELLITVKDIKLAFCHIDRRRKPATTEEWIQQVLCSPRHQEALEAGTHIKDSHGACLSSPVFEEVVFFSCSPQQTRTTLSSSRVCCGLYAISRVFLRKEDFAAKSTWGFVPPVVTSIDELMRIGRTIFIQPIDQWCRLHLH